MRSTDSQPTAPHRPSLVHLAAADALMGLDPSLIRVWQRRVEFVEGSRTDAAASPSPMSPRSQENAVAAHRAAARDAGRPAERRRDPVAPASPAPPASSSTPSMQGADRAALLEALREEHDASCPHCTTATAHTRTVFGEGSPVAEVMFVGEAPGETEDRLGRPFVGRAGEKLDQIITAMGLSRGDVYIANVLKSRPPDNRTPLRGEIEGCGPYLRRQIGIIQPRAIVTLGGPATQLLLGVDVGITRLRGIWASYALDDRTIPVMPTFHPAYLLRNYTPETRRQVWEDMQKVLEMLGSAR